MFSKLTTLFKPDVSKLTLVEKLELLKKKKINLYKKPWNYTTGSFLEINIGVYIEKYNYINNFSIEAHVIQVGSISETSYLEKLYSEWFTIDNKLIINKDEILNEWINQGISLAKLYEFRSTLIGVKNNSYLNAKRIAPYYHNLNTIATQILTT